MAQEQGSDPFELPPLPGSAASVATQAADPFDLPPTMDSAASLTPPSAPPSAPDFNLGGTSFTPGRGISPPAPYTPPPQGPPTPTFDLDSAVTGWKKLAYQGVRALADATPIDEAMGVAPEQLAKERVIDQFMGPEETWRGMTSREHAMQMRMGLDPAFRVQVQRAQEGAARSVDILRASEAKDRSEHTGSRVAGTVGSTAGTLAELAVIPGAAPVKFAAQAALDPLLQEQLGGREAEGNVFTRGAEGLVTGAILHGASEGGKAGFEALAERGFKVNPRVAEGVTQAGVGGAMGAINAPPGEKGEQAAVDASIFGLLGAAGRPPVSGKPHVFDETDTHRLTPEELASSGIAEPTPSAEPLPADSMEVMVGKKLVRVKKPSAGEEVAPEPAQTINVPGRGPVFMRKNTDTAKTYRDVKVGPIEGDVATKASILQKLKDLHESFGTEPGQMPFMGKKGDSYFGKMMRGGKSILWGHFNNAIRGAPNENIRTLFKGDVDTISHEVTHHMEQYLARTGAVSRHTLEAWAEEIPGNRELDRLASAGDKVSEGFAEFTRIWLMNPAEAKARAPVFTARFEKEIARRDPKLWEKLADLQGAFTSVREAPVQGRVRSLIATPQDIKGAQYKAPLRERIRGLYRDLFDKGEPINFMGRTLRRQVADEAGVPYRQVTLPVKNDPGLMIGWVRRSAPTSETIIKDGIINGKTGEVIPGSPSIEGTLKDVGDGKQHDFEDFWIESRIIDQLDSGDKRIVEASKRFLESVKVPEDKFRADHARLAADNPQFIKGVEDMTAIGNGMLDYAVDNGALSRDAADAMKTLYKSYASLATFDPSNAGSKLSGSGLGVVDTPAVTHRYRGEHELPIMPPILSIMRKAETLPRIAHRAAAGKVLVDTIKAIKGGSVFGVKIDKSMLPESFEVREIKKQLEKAGVSIPDTALDEIVTVFRPEARPKGENIVQVIVDGKPEYWKLNDAVYEAAMNLDKSQLSGFGKALAAVAHAVTNIKRASITLSAAFQIRNLTRDQFERFANTGMLPGQGILEGIKIAAQRGKEFREWQRAGGSMSTMGSQYLPEVAARYEQLAGVESRGRRVFENTKALLSHIDDLEAASRIATFKRRLRDPLPIDRDPRSQQIRAGSESAEGTVDFSRVGKALTGMRTITAFLNPSLQGTDRFVRTIKDNPERAATLLGLMATSTAAIRQWNESDKERKRIYDNEPEYLKNSSWIVVLDKDNVLVVPKPFEWGLFASTIPERVIEDNIYRDQSASDTVANVRRAAGEALLPNVIPDVAIPFLESWANRSLSRGTQIVPDSELQNSPGMQYDENASELAKLIGAQTNTSPRKWDNALRVGGVANTVLDVTDEASAKIAGKLVPERPSRGMSDVPGIGTFFGKPVSGNAEPLQDFYREMERLRSVKADVEKLKGERDLRGAQAAMRTGQRDLAYLEVGEDIAKNLAKLRKQLKATMVDTSLSGDQKASIRDDLVLKQIGMSRRFLDLIGKGYSKK